MKYIIILIVIAVVLWFTLRRNERPQSGQGRHAAAPKAMVRCAQCGLHLPADDAVTDGSLHFCSEAHRALGASPRQ